MTVIEAEIICVRAARLWLSENQTHDPNASMVREAIEVLQKYHNDLHAAVLREQKAGKR
jgi:hypothetical protein